MCLLASLLAAITTALLNHKVDSEGAAIFFFFLGPRIFTWLSVPFGKGAWEGKEFSMIVATLPFKSSRMVCFKQEHSPLVYGLPEDNFVYTQQYWFKFQKAVIERVIAINVDDMF